MIRYLDIPLPPNVKVMLKVTPSGMEDLRYDSDGDGTYETVVSPTASASGALANDQLPPAVGFALTYDPNGVSVKLNATDDLSGVEDLFYSFDVTANAEQHYTPYTSPFKIAYSSEPAFEYLTHDRLANRGFGGYKIKLPKLAKSYSEVSAIGGDSAVGVSFALDLNDKREQKINLVPASNAAWLTTGSSINVQGGQGTVTFSVAPNNAPTPRTGTINIGGQTFTVTQEAGLDTIPPTIIAPSNLVVNAGINQCAANVNAGSPTVDDNLPGVTFAVVRSDSKIMTEPFAVGVTTITWKATDAAGNTTTASQTVTVLDNQAPSIVAPVAITLTSNTASCGLVISDSLLGNATASDNCSSVSITRSGIPAGNLFPLGTTTVTYTAKDTAGNVSTATQTVTVTNPAPVVTLTAPATGVAYPIGTPINFTGSFTDNPGIHSATWTFDNLTSIGTVNESIGAVGGSYTFAAAGVYKVSLTVADGCGGTGTANTIDSLDLLIVVYDPNGGWVTGGGWINSPAGAYVPSPLLTGKANFGFVSKYKNGSSVPTGNTEFQFKAGNLNFSSTSYEWMVIAGARAQYKGAGTINGSGDYRFMLTAIDGQEPGGGGQDKFRIRIWNNAGGGLVYDNQLNAPDTAEPTTILSGGQIVIHK